MKWDPECKMVTSILYFWKYFKGLNLRVNWIWSSYLDHCLAVFLRGKEATQKNCQTVLLPKPLFWTLLPHYICPPVLNWFSPMTLSECPHDDFWTYTEEHLPPSLTLPVTSNTLPSSDAIFHSYSLSLSCVTSVIHMFTNTCGLLNTGNPKSLPSRRR